MTSQQSPEEEGTARAKAQRQKQVWGVPGTDGSYWG